MNALIFVKFGEKCQGEGGHILRPDSKEGNSNNYTCLCFGSGPKSKDLIAIQNKPDTENITNNLWN